MWVIDSFVDGKEWSFAVHFICAIIRLYELIGPINQANNIQNGPIVLISFTGYQVSRPTAHLLVLSFDFH